MPAMSCSNLLPLRLGGKSKPAPPTAPPASPASVLKPRTHDLVAEQRPAVDDMIMDLWDTIEFNLRTEEPSSLRRKAREWGVVYDEAGEAELPPPPPPEP